MEYKLTLKIYYHFASGAVKGKIRCPRIETGMGSRSETGIKSALAKLDLLKLNAQIHIFNSLGGSHRLFFVV